MGISIDWFIGKSTGTSNLITDYPQGPQISMVLLSYAFLQMFPLNQWENPCFQTKRKVSVVVAAMPQAIAPSWVPWWWCPPERKAKSHRRSIEFLVIKTTKTQICLGL